MDASCLDEAALELAISSRELQGLPIERHCESNLTTEATIPYSPQVLDRPPSALQFSQKIAASSPPLIIQHCIDDRPASSKWQDLTHLCDALSHRNITFAATSDGRADDLKKTPDGKLVFGLPAEVQMSLRDFINKKGSGSVYYLQSQDSNLTDSNSSAGDLTPLLKDLQSPNGSLDLSWATEALASEPEAMNLWIGEDRSRSSMHRDHYENLFTVLLGKKIFTVVPPTEAYFLCEDKPYACHRHSSEPPHHISSSPDPNTPPTPWIPIDPTEPPTSARNAPHERYAKGLKPLRIEVNQGETLYLPAGWWHFVEQQGRKDDTMNGGITIGINWWYESQAAFGPQWALLDFVKRVDELQQA
ncbi:unnamed protein product [Sympodiomycopsis kandeliae]